MRTVANKKGLTLVEIIIALAILGIIVVSFLGMFTTAISAVFMMGDHSRTILEAQALLDKVYEDASREEDEFIDDIENILVEMGYTDITVNGTVIEAQKEGSNIVISIETFNLYSKNDAKNVKIESFYRNNTRSVELLSPMPIL